jgi:hypothetical protein
MKSQTILFSTPMVKAILNGYKTQTRRVIKMRDGSLAEDEDISLDVNGDLDYVMDFSKSFPYWRELKPKAMPEDIFWVRETWCNMQTASRKEDNGFRYKASIGKNNFTWRPSIFMPKEACRLFLKVTNVRVERLKDISMEDAIAEGIQPITAHNDPNRILGWHDYTVDPKDGFNTFFDPRESFFSLWESINGKESLDQNPWVWIFDFDSVDKPENFN